MGDGGKPLLRLRFNPKIRLEFRGATITSDAGRWHAESPIERYNVKLSTPEAIDNIGS